MFRIGDFAKGTYCTYLKEVIAKTWHFFLINHTLHINLSVPLHYILAPPGYKIHVGGGKFTPAAA